MRAVYRKSHECDAHDLTGEILFCCHCLFEVADQFGGNAFRLLLQFQFKYGDGTVYHIIQSNRILVGMIASNAPFNVGLKLMLYIERL